MKIRFQITKGTFDGRHYYDEQKRIDSCSSDATTSRETDSASAGGADAGPERAPSQAAAALFSAAGRTGLDLSAPWPTEQSSTPSPGQSQSPRTAPQTLLGFRADSGPRKARRTSRPATFGR